MTIGQAVVGINVARFGNDQTIVFLRLSRSVRRMRSAGNRYALQHGQPSLCRQAAEAQIQDRSRTETGLNTALAFSRVSNRTNESKQHRASEPDFSKTYFLWISTDSMTSPCWMARTMSMPLVTLPKTAWQEVPWTWQGLSCPST